MIGGRDATTNKRDRAMAERDITVRRVEMVVHESHEFISIIKDEKFHEMVTMMGKAHMEAQYWQDQYERVVQLGKRVESFLASRSHSHQTHQTQSSVGVMGPMRPLLRAEGSSSRLDRGREAMDSIG